MRDEEIKYKVFSYYSKENFPECCHCGYIDIRALCLDHINGDGNKHKRNGNRIRGINLYKKLLQDNFQSEFKLQVLCANCNLIKFFENKECVHTKSDEWKARMSIIQSRIKKKTGKHSSRSKKVYQYNIDNKFIREWDYIKEAESFYNENTNAKNIVACCNGRQHTAYGYKWKHTKD